MGPVEGARDDLLHRLVFQPEGQRLLHSVLDGFAGEPRPSDPFRFGSPVYTPAPGRETW